MSGTLIAVSETKAARLLDMSKREFLELVECGALPQPAHLSGSLRRWRLAQLAAIVDGAAIIEEDFQP